MFISRKRVHSIAPPSLTIDGTPLIEVTEYKYLGVTITSDMTWSPHITNVCNKSRKLVDYYTGVSIGTQPHTHY